MAVGNALLGVAVATAGMGVAAETEVGAELGAAVGATAGAGCAGGIGVAVGSDDAHARAKTVTRDNKTAKSQKPEVCLFFTHVLLK